MSHGYMIVDEVIVGDDNPDWHDAPVVIKIVRIALHGRGQAFLLIIFTDGPRASSAGQCLEGLG